MHTPSMKEMQRVAALWQKCDSFARYKVDDEKLRALFVKFPHNTKLDEVVQKVRLLDVLYSAGATRNAGSARVVAEKIVKIKDFDKRLKNGDIELVSELTSSFKRKIISFSSKFCALHSEFIYKNEDNFVIYDSLVCKQLKHFKKQDKFTKLGIDTSDYSQFKQILEEFRAFYKLKCSLRELDWYLWKLGKMD